jgi:hypothetical protein
LCGGDFDLIPLNYQTPPQKPPLQLFSVAVRFALGVGLGFLIITLLHAMHGDLDILMGPACNGVVYMSVGGGTFYVAGRIRKVVSKTKLIERNTLATVIIGAVCVLVVVTTEILLPDYGATGAQVGFIVWIAVSAGANWIALRPEVAST